MTDFPNIGNNPDAFYHLNLTLHDTNYALPDSVADYDDNYNVDADSGQQNLPLTEGSLQVLELSWTKPRGKKKKEKKYFSLEVPPLC